MRSAVIPSEIDKFDILTNRYEASETDAYPMVLHNLEKNNAHFGKHQYYLADLVYHIKNALQNPITFKDDQLTLFSISLIGTKDPSVRKMGSMTAYYISKLDCLCHDKIKEPLLREIHSITAKVITKAFAQDNTDINLNAELAQLLGLSAIVACDLDKFFNLRQNTRNYILKALRYIISDDAVNDAILPELTQYKKHFKWTLEELNERIYDSLVSHYHLVDENNSYQHLLSEVRHLAVCKLNDCKMDIPLYLKHLEVSGRHLPLLNELCEKYKELARYILATAARHNDSSKSFASYLDKAVEIINDHVDEYDLYSRLHALLVTSFMGDNTSIFGKRERFEQVQERNPDYLKLIYAFILNETYNCHYPSAELFIFLENFFLSDYYSYSPESHQKLLQLVNDQNADKHFHQNIRSSHNFFAKDRSEVYGVQTLARYGKLLQLVLAAGGDAVQNWNAIYELGLLTTKIPNQNVSYEDVLKDYDNYGDFLNLLRSHDGWLGRLERFRESNILQFTTAAWLNKSKHDFDLHLSPSVQAFKVAADQLDLESIITVPLLNSIEYSRLVLLPFTKENTCIAMVTHINLSRDCESAFALFKLHGKTISDADRLEALKIVDYLNTHYTKAP